jgi:hypothetical protein
LGWRSLAENDEVEVLDLDLDFSAGALAAFHLHYIHGFTPRHSTCSLVFEVSFGLYIFAMSRQAWCKQATRRHYLYF